MIKKRKVYLDYAATTPVDDRVFEVMRPYFSQKFGNTASLHGFGRMVDQVLSESRKSMANFLNCEEEEIIFTSSATESNNLALKGVAEANWKKGKHVIISSIEHDCVIESARWLGRQGWEVSQLGVDKDGLANIDELKKIIKKETVLVSVIHGNNEVGTIQDIGLIGEICKERGVLFHTDASQSFGKVKIDVKEMKIDLLTASSHKIYGPKGAALLYVKKGIKIEPILHGGGHEGGLRSSTVNVPAIVGFTKATELCRLEMDRENSRLVELRGRLLKGILTTTEGTKLNGHPIKRLANNVNVSFANIEGESLLLELDRWGIACSTGSACSSRNLEASHVLTAMGMEARVAHGSIRFSLGRWTSKEDIDYVLEVLPKVVSKLRKISPYKLGGN